MNKSICRLMLTDQALTYMKTERGYKFEGSVLYNMEESWELLEFDGTFYVFERASENN